MSTDFWSVASSNVFVQKTDRRRLAAEVQYILLQFEKPKEWADLTNCLIRLYKTIKHSTIDEIPHKETICKRLAQCLNPQLPSGVHTRALEVYGSILEKVGPDGLARDLALFSSGLFPFFTYSSLSVKPIFLNLIDQYYIPLGKKLLPCLIGLLICILPGLDEEKSETYQNVYKTLEKISDCVSERSFVRALWVILLKASRIRLQTLSVIANKLSPRLHLLPKDRIDVLLPNCHVLVIKSLEATTEDESLLVLREMITLLIRHFPLDSNILNYDEKTILCRQCLKLITRRDWSLTRRLYEWIFNSTNDFSDTLDLTYFNKYSKDNLISAIEDLLMNKGKTLDEALIPIKIIIAFISDAYLAGITDKLMPELCIPILKYICREHEEEEWRNNIIQETRLIFNPSLTPTNVIFAALVDEYNDLVACGYSNCPNVWSALLELGNVYLDEICPTSTCKATICGLFMLLDNALRNLHNLNVRKDLFVINQMITNVKAIFSRIEAIIHGSAEDDRFSANVNRVEDEGQLDQLNDCQTACNEKISHYLDSFYTDALNHFEQRSNELSIYELNTMDALSDLAVRFVAIENYLAVVPITKVLSNSLDGFESHIADYQNEHLNRTIYQNSIVLVDACERSPLKFSIRGITSEGSVKFELEQWMKALLKTTTSTNSQLFCRGIRTFIDLLRLPYKSQLRQYIADSGHYMRSIILQLWSSLDSIHAPFHSDIVLLMLQFNSAVPSSRAEAERVIVKDLTVPETDLKIQAMLRFGVLWRYAHIHQPDGEIFPEAIGCILDNVEETDPKLRYYSRSFLSESINMLSNLLDPILKALLSYDKIDPSSYSSCISEVLRKFRHLSSIVGREGQGLLDAMQRHQAPPQLLILLQGKDTFNRMSGTYATITKRNRTIETGNNDVSVPSYGTVSMDNHDSLVDDYAPLIVFPRLKDPHGISYEDECIYDYVDLLIVITLKYICLNVNVTNLLTIKNMDELNSYSESVCNAERAKDSAVEENTMLFRCTAIDFLKLFLSTIQPQSRAKEVACLVSRPLLSVLYHLHLKDETIIQTQLIYLLKVVMDRCHLESNTLSKTTLALVDSVMKLTKKGSFYTRNIICGKSSEFHTAFTKFFDNDSVNTDDVDTTTDNVLDGLDSSHGTGPVGSAVVPSVPDLAAIEDTGVEAKVIFDVLQEQSTNVNSDLSNALSPDTECGKSTKGIKDPFERKSNVLPRIYVMNVAAIKQSHIGRLKRLSDEALFAHIIELCVRNSAKFKRPQMLQLYVDFSLYNLKYLSGSRSTRYASNFITEFCAQLSARKDTIGVTGLSVYLKGIYHMLAHLSGTSQLGTIPDVKNQSRFYAEDNHDLFNLHSMSSSLFLSEQCNSRRLSNVDDNGEFIKPTRKSTVMRITESQATFELSEIVFTCIQCLVWAKSSKIENDSVSRDNSPNVSDNSVSSSDTVIRNSDRIVYNHSSSGRDAAKIDITMSIGTLTSEILRLFRLLYVRLPYHFTEGCLCLWDQTESSKYKQEIKLEILNTLNSICQFSRSKMLSYILDMLEPFAKSSRYRETHGFFLLNCIVRDNPVFEFIHALIAGPQSSKRDVEETFEVLKRLVQFVLYYPRQPCVLLWVFHTICSFDRFHPSKDVNVINKHVKKLLNDIMYMIIYLSAGLYMHKVCTWLQAKLYDLEPPLPVHVMLINKRYYECPDRKTSPSVTQKSVGNVSLSFQSPPENAYDSMVNKSRLMDPIDCSAKNGLAQLILFNYEVGQLNRRTAVINIFFQVLCSNLTSYIIPMLQERSDSPLHSRYLTLLLLRNLPFSLYDGSLCCIKKSVVEYMQSSDFFKTDRRSLRCFINLFRHVADEDCKGTTDRLIMLDFYTSPPHSSVFSSRFINIQSRIKYLKRLAFVLYACRTDTFARYIATILERLTENYRAHDDYQLKAKSLLVMRVLLIKMSQEHLTSLWPVLLSELIKIFDRERRSLAGLDSKLLPLAIHNENSLDSVNAERPLTNGAEEEASNKLALLTEAVKIIDVACTLRLNDFLIYQWMFVSDLVDKDLNTDSDKSNLDTSDSYELNMTNFDFKPFLMIVEQMYTVENKMALATPSIGSASDSNELSLALSRLKGGDQFSGNLNQMDQQFKQPLFYPNTDGRTISGHMIDTSIEDGLLEMDKDLIDFEPELNIHQIYKIYRKTL